MTTVIGALLEKHAKHEGAEELALELEQAEAELAAIDAKLESVESEEERAELTEKRMTAAEKRNARIRRLRLKKDPSYRRAQDKAAKMNRGLKKPKYSVQRDEETGEWTVDKIDLELSKRAKVAAKKRAK